MEMKLKDGKGLSVFRLIFYLINKLNDFKIKTFNEFNKDASVIWESVEKNQIIMYFRTLSGCLFGMKR